MTAMAYAIRTATLADIPHIVQHRERMFREMGIAARFDEMAAETDRWLQHAIPTQTYRAWMAVTDVGEIAAGSGLVVMPWPPGPISLDPRCGFVFNVYTEPAHRKQGLARRLMEALHAHCRHERIERLVLNASTFGQPLYRAIGYVVTDEPMMRFKL